MAAALTAAIGAENLTQPPREMGSEDFSEFVAAGVPGVYLWIGAVEPGKYAASKQGGPALPTTHSPLFAPDVVPTLKALVGTPFPFKVNPRGEMLDVHVPEKVAQVLRDAGQAASALALLGQK